jgi:hypothetical protein
MRGIAALASPLVWFASHGVQYALAPLTCAWHSNVVLWIATLVALLLDGASGYLAWNQWQRTPGGEASIPPWLAMSGVALSAGFFLVILAQAIPALMLPGCE